MFKPLTRPHPIAVALQVAGRAIQPAQRQDDAAIVNVHIPTPFALSGSLAHLVAPLEAHRPLVVTDPAVEEALTGQFGDDSLFGGRRVGVVPEDTVPAPAQVGHEVEAEVLVGQGRLRRLPPPSFHLSWQRC